MKHAAILLALLVLTAGQARAQMALGAPIIGNPCAPGYDADAGVVLEAAPDGGPAEPAPICQGQRAPQHGVFLTVPRAAAMAAERASLKDQNAHLQQALQVAQANQPMPPVFWVVTCVVAAAAGAYVAHKI